MLCHLFLSEPDTAAISGKASKGLINGGVQLIKFKARTKKGNDPFFLLNKIMLLRIFGFNGFGTPCVAHLIH